MNEQEQAQVLSDWLEKPVGTPAPLGLDPDVLESVYAMQPDRAPAPTLTADDIFADFQALNASLVAGLPEDLASEPAEVAAIPRTQVSAAPAWWRSANRVGGLGVLMATAATLLLVVLPTMQSEAPVASVAEDVATASAPSAALEEIALQRVAPAAEVAAPKAAPLVAPPPAVASNDGVAIVDEEDGNRYDMARGQPVAGSMIPEVAAAAEAPMDEAEPVESGLDAVAALDDEDQRAFDVGDANPNALAVEGLAEKTAEKSRPAQAKRNSKADAAAPSAPAADVAPQPSKRNAAVPSDLTDAWRDRLDAASRASIDQALRIADVEARNGQYLIAANAVRPHVRAPADAGQHMAAKAVEWYLAAGDTGAAVSTAQAGLVLTQENTPWRSWLLVMYGDAQAARGDVSAAEAAYSQAQALNASR